MSGKQQFGTYKEPQEMCYFLAGETTGAKIDERVHLIFPSDLRRDVGSEVIAFEMRVMKSFLEVQTTK